MALNSFTGTLTKPNEIAPLQIDRGISAPHVPSRSSGFLPAGGFRTSRCDAPAGIQVA